MAFYNCSCQQIPRIKSRQRSRWDAEFGIFLKKNPLRNEFMLGWERRRTFKESDVELTMAFYQILQESLYNIDCMK